MITASRPRPVGGVSSILLRSSPESVVRARSHVGANAHMYDADRYTSGIIVSELATNAVVHARGESIIIRLYLSDQGPVIEVWDQSTAAPVVGRLESLHDSGRGLAMVEFMAKSLGWVRLAHHGKVVYAVLESEGS
ncbi:ATP-binding protein [Spirillospora sp. NPDC127200]